MKQVMFDGNPVCLNGKPVMEFIHDGKLVQAVMSDPPIKKVEVSKPQPPLRAGDILGTFHMPRMNVTFMYLGPTRS